MEFSKWGQKAIQEISERSKSLYAILEAALEHEKNHVPFTADDDLERFAAEAEAERGTLSIDDLFLRLVARYDAGFHLKSPDWKPSQAFILGRSFATLSEGVGASLPLPKIDRLQVLKARSAPVLKLFELDKVAKLQDSACFLFRPTYDDAFLLLIKRGRPWLIDRVEATNRGLAAWAGLKAPRSAFGGAMPAFARIRE